MVNVVVFPRSEDGKSIRNLLLRSGYEVAAVCISGAQALQALDQLGEGVVICGYKFSDMLYSQLYENMPSTFEMLLIASPGVLSEGIEEGIVSISMPLKVRDLVNTLEMITERLSYKRKKRRAAPRQRRESERKVIEEAKALLMERNHMTEDEAHRYLQKTSMDSGNTLVETAQMVFALMRY